MSSPACPYCKKLCRLIGTYKYQCDYHGSVRVQVVPASNNDVLDVTLVVIRDDATFNCTFFHNYDHPNKFRVEKVNRRPKTNQIVVTLDFHPPLTPENIEAKLETLILFS